MNLQTSSELLEMDTPSNVQRLCLGPPYTYVDYNYKCVKTNLRCACKQDSIICKITHAILTKNKTHYMPTLRCIYPLSDVLPLFTHMAHQNMRVYGANFVVNRHI